MPVPTRIPVRKFIWCRNQGTVFYGAVFERGRHLFMKREKDIKDKKDKKDNPFSTIDKNSLRWKLMSTKKKIRTIIKESNREEQQRAWERLKKALEELEKNKELPQTENDEEKK